MNLTFKASDDGEHIIQDIDGAFRAVNFQTADIILKDWHTVRRGILNLFLEDAVDKVILELTTAVMQAEMNRRKAAAND